MSGSGGLRAGLRTQAQRAGEALLQEEVRSSRRTHQSSFLGAIWLPARREEGQTLLEYALILGFIALATVPAMIALGPTIGQAFQVVTDVIQEHMSL